MSGTIKRGYRFTVAPEHLILDRRLSDRAYRLWCRLDRFAGDNGSAFPSRKRLAFELDCHVNSVDRALRELIDTGWLRTERATRGMVNNYVLTEGDREVIEAIHGDALAAWESARSQVKEGATMGDDTQSATTHGDGVPPQVRTRPTTHGEQKEASSSGNQEGEIPMPTASAASVVAEALAGQPDLPLDGMPTPPDTKGVRTDPAVKASEAAQGVSTPEEARKALARDLSTRFHDWYIANVGPIVKTGRTLPFHGVVKMVESALDAGYTEAEIGHALKACGERHMPVPSTAVFQARLSEIRSGRSAAPTKAPANRHTDDDPGSRALMAKAEQAWGATG